jgi:hypothetical protein
VNTAGAVTIDCPICTRRVSFPTTMQTIDHGSRGVAVRVTLDMDAVAAHLLTHGQHDGEPLTAAA